MMSKLPPVLIDFLRLNGLPESKIDSCDFNTSLYHDLGIYGEAAEDYLEVLIDQYHVDMAYFDFDRYFPPEYPGKTPLTRVLIWNFPYIWKLFAPKEDKAKFMPLTLGMIEQAIDQKKWVESTKLHM